MPESAPIAGLVLAAGQSTRFRAAAPEAATKAVALLEGRPLVRHVVETALAAGLSPVIVVTGFAREAVVEALGDLAVTFAHNPAFETGLASSLKTGVAALGEDCAGAMILLADMPRVSPQALQRLADALRANPGAVAVAPTWRGQRGNPALLSRALFAEVAGLQGDVGARPLLAGRADVIEVTMDDAGVAYDVDTPEALADLNGRSGTLKE